MTEAATAEEYLSVSEAGERFGFDPGTIRKWIKCGVLPISRVADLEVRENEKEAS